MGGALEARGIPSAGKLSADVEGDVEDVDGVLRITKIRLTFRATIPAGTKEKFDRALEVYSEKCPAYQSIKECIDCTWDASVREE